MAKPRITHRLPQFAAQVQAKGVRGMTQALVLGASEASVLTPIDTSTLLNSQYRRVETEAHKVVGRVGYTAVYAEPVHDPEHQQRFRRPTAEKEFLVNGFERAEPHIRAVICGAIKT
ncbi:hypothetical protein DJFAAGMI_01274 [Comamonas sp. PE63]|uniref:HK97 gp10 family phage protein n=1 Tax=Comamonas brasiliensis TaxID=1812482 RepID=A0ABS5LQD7_9BURK|nr:hypothetical protein [Comamonas sp. PE63]MBS3018542.1 hypothetical protein [Comamonas sp. PE63]